MIPKSLFSVSVAVLVVFLVFTLMPTALAATDDSPSGVHLTWSSDNTAHTMTVNWWTSSDNSGDKVMYDTQSQTGNPDQYSLSETGSHHTFSGFSGYVHEVELTGLSPDTTYYFVWGGENGGYSQGWSFRTAPTERSDVTFAGGGDSRRAYSGEGSTTPFPEARNDVSREMAKRNPDFAIYSGDFVLDWDNQLQWENWFSSMQDFWVTENGRMIPVIPAVGNHEVSGPYEENKSDSKYYYEQFALPRNERWYSLDWGSELHIVVLDSEVHPSELSEHQYEWLVNDLASHKDFRWNIVTFHRPPFSKGGHHGSYLPVRGAWSPLFDNYGVDIVINAHSHNYQRTKPIVYSEEEGAKVAGSGENGTVYLVSGGWGAPVYSVGEGDLTAKVAKRNNFLLFELSADENKLTMNAIDKNGSSFDSATFPKEGVEGPPEFPTIPPLLIVVTVGLVVFVVGFYYSRG